VTDLLTPKEVAERLKCSERFVLDELRRKNLRGFKLSGWRVDEADLETYICAHANVRPVRRPASPS
jgi:excisionase family DNA binding protein